MTALQSVLAKIATLVSGARVRYREPLSAEAMPRQAIYFANHSSHLDFVTLWAALSPALRASVRPVAAKDYWGSGIKSYLAEKVFRAYLVDRGGSGQAAAAAAAPTTKSASQIEGMQRVLDEGDSLIIFPEGTRGDGQEVATFHSGLYHLARHAPHVPVVPVGLHNLGRMLPKGGVIPVPHLATVSFCTPLTVTEDETKDAFLDRARAALIADLADRAGKESS